jgi:hypothetical protein
VHGHDVRRKPHSPTASKCAELPVALFRVQEEALVESPDVVQRLRAKEQDCTDEKDPARRESTAQLEGIDPRFSWRGNRPDHSLRRAAGVDQARCDGCCPWIFSEDGGENPRKVRRDVCVGVQKEHVVPPAVGQCNVDTRSKSDVAARREIAATIVCDDPLHLRIGTIVDDDESMARAQRVQRLRKLSGVAIRDHDDRRLRRVHEVMVSE